MLPSADLDALCREPRALQPLIDYLRATSYTLSAIAELVADPEPANFITNAGRCAFLYDDELREHEAPLAVLTRLFLLGGRIEPAQFSVVPAEVRNLLTRRKLVSEYDAAIVSEVTVTELDGTYIVSDKLFENTEGDIEVHSEPDAVWPTSEWSLSLFSRLARDPRWTSLLDVGCGTGCISLFARARYSNVTGFDLNSRAVAFARLNAALNGATASYERGDCLTYQGRFNHVVFASPAGPSLGAEAEQRALVSHGGRFGHELAMQFMARAGELVAPGGCCQTWSIFAVPHPHEDVAAFVTSALPDMAIAVEEIQSGGLYVSRDHIANGKVPAGMHYASGEAGSEFVERLRANGIAELVSAVVTLRPR